MEQALEIAGTLIGLLYLWLEYRASIYLWIAGIVMPAVYIFVYYEAGLYADFGINIYYLGATVYGWVMWKYGAFLRRTILRRKSCAPQRGENKRTENGTTHYPHTQALPVAPCRHLCRCFRRYCPDINRIHRQQCALVRLLHHRTQYHRHVDAGTQICGAMVGMDSRRCRECRPVHLQRTSFYRCPLCTLHNYRYLRLL